MSELSADAALSADEKFWLLPDEKPVYAAPPPEFSFTAAARRGGHLYLSGHGPNLRTRPPQFDYTGKVGAAVDLLTAVKASRLVGLNLLVTAREAMGTLNAVKAVIETRVMVNSAVGFKGQSEVANGCTDLFVEIFGNAGKGARIAVGASELPFDMAIEIAALFAVK